MSEQKLSAVIKVMRVTKEQEHQIDRAIKLLEEGHKSLKQMIKERAGDQGLAGRKRNLHLRPGTSREAAHSPNRRITKKAG